MYIAFEKVDNNIKFITTQYKRRAFDNNLFKIYNIDNLNNLPNNIIIEQIDNKYKVLLLLHYQDNTEKFYYDDLDEFKKKLLTKINFVKRDIINL